MNQPAYAITQQYKGNFDEAVEGISSTLKKEGFGILTLINVKETLKNKLDVDYPNYTILGACNPPNAYKALQAEKEIGLLLPCNLIVYEENDIVYISIMRPTSVLMLSDNPTIAKIAQQIESKLIVALNNVINLKKNQI